MVSPFSIPKCIVHIPHSSRHIPLEFRDQFLLSDADLMVERIRMTDGHTDDLFSFPPQEVRTLRFPMSRLLVDPERFEDDAREIMFQKGMGVLYTKTAHGDSLRRSLSSTERTRLLECFYRPHHARLTELVDDTLASHNRCLILDAHSFPSRPLPYEWDQSQNRPEICIGADSFHTPKELEEACVNGFLARGYSVEVNRPFKGSLVPMAHFQVDRRVSSIMVEIRRDLYMDELTGRKIPRFKSIKKDLCCILQGLWGS